ncbi:MAG: hypothetical protein EBV06_00730 [Planctomycetia bacterium]|nr:hypothetical protein [Planctomycetia bacterium]
MSKIKQLLIVVVVMMLGGCGTTSPSLLPGDEVRPDIAFAPKAPWSPGARVNLGMLVQVHRPGRSHKVYLSDNAVSPNQAVMRATITFFNGENTLGKALEVPFVRDC